MKFFVWWSTVDTLLIPPFLAVASMLASPCEKKPKNDFAQAVPVFEPIAPLATPPSHFTSAKIEPTAGDATEKQPVSGIMAATANNTASFLISFSLDPMDA